MLRSIVVRRSPIHGSGVFAARNLPAETTVVQYRGLVISHEEADRLHGGGIETGHTFLFTLNDEFVIDANRSGNSARWINHSCEPNCEAVIEEDPKGDRSRDRIYIQTIRPIRRGEELTYDYGIKLQVRHTPRLKRLWACRCGSPHCTGTMLEARRPRRAPATSGRSGTPPGTAPGTTRASRGDSAGPRARS